MKERLIELLSDLPFSEEYEKYNSLEWVEHLVDYLLENGVIVLPCKVGQTVYVPWSWGFSQGIATVKVEEVKFYDDKNNYMFLIDMESDDECFNQTFGGWKIADSIGKTVFLTKEEAEQKLRKEDENE